MNGEEAKWLEKIFKQHNRDQQLYLDTKFDSLAEELKKQADNCKALRTECRRCIDADMTAVEDQVDELETVCAVIEEDLVDKIRKNTLIGSAVAVFASLTLWAAFGENAIAYVINFVKLLFIGG